MASGPVARTLREDGGDLFEVRPVNPSSATANTTAPVGIFARRAIRKGEIVLEDEPALAWRGSGDAPECSGLCDFDEPSTRQAAREELAALPEEAIQQFEALPPGKQAEVLQLWNEFGDMPNRPTTCPSAARGGPEEAAYNRAVRNFELAGIYRTNGLVVSAPPEGERPDSSAVEGGTAAQKLHLLCPLYSRTNHSCEPNAAYSWCAERRRLTIVAVKDIGSGEQVVQNYMREAHLMPRCERQRVLKDRLGFECLCPLCRATARPISVSDANRELIQQLRSDLFDALHSAHSKLGSSVILVRDGSGFAAASIDEAEKYELCAHANRGEEVAKLLLDLYEREGAIHAFEFETADAAFMLTRLQVLCIGARTEDAEREIMLKKACHSYASMCVGAATLSQQPELATRYSKWADAGCDELPGLDWLLQEFGLG